MHRIWTGTEGQVWTKFELLPSSTSKQKLNIPVYLDPNSRSTFFTVNKNAMALAVWLFILLKSYFFLEHMLLHPMYAASFVMQQVYLGSGKSIEFVLSKYLQDKDIIIQ